MATETATIFRAERAATQKDAGTAAVKAEEREWEASLDDGIDSFLPASFDPSGQLLSKPGADQREESA